MPLSQLFIHAELIHTHSWHPQSIRSSIPPWTNGRWFNKREPFVFVNHSHSSGIIKRWSDVFNLQNMTVDFVSLELNLIFLPIALMCSTTQAMVTRVWHWCIHAGFSNHNAQSRISHHANESDDTTTEAPNHHLLCVLTAHKNEMSCSSHVHMWCCSLEPIEPIELFAMKWNGVKKHTAETAETSNVVFIGWWDKYESFEQLVEYFYKSHIDDNICLQQKDGRQ